MSRILECIVIEPPTGAELCARATSSLPEGEFDVTVLPEQEVPKAVPITLAVRLGQLSLNVPEYAAILSTRAVNSEEYSSVVMRMQHMDEPATADIVTQF